MVKIVSYKIIWDEIALKQLNNYLEYVSKQNLTAPSIIKGGVLNILKTVKKNPFIYEVDKLNDQNDSTYRAFIIYSYRVTYCLHGNTIRILRIRHTSQEPLEY
jgi:plasmid stabilization system protein ParE